MKIYILNMEPIYAVVRGDEVVAGPFPNKRLARANCYEGEEVVEVLPTDQGYEEFKSSYGGIIMHDYKLNMTLQHFLSIHEADAVAEMLYDEDYTSADIIEYIDWCGDRYGQDLDTEFESWLEDRKPRVKIEFLVTECGCKIHEELEFPKRDEDMDHGTEYEWYYSLREVTDEIMALPVGGSMNFKIRDDKDSHGVIIRTA